jgi:hypothetical protein
MSFDLLLSPLAFLEYMLGNVPHRQVMEEYVSWWEREGKAISRAVDQSGTPWLRMFDRFGQRIDEILFPPEYWRMLKKGYQAGVVWRAFEENSLLPVYCLALHGCAVG